MRKIHTMLKVIPRSWLSWDFTVTDESRPVAEIGVAWLRERGVLKVEGTTYEVYREGLVSGDYVLEGGGSVLARARKLGALRRAFSIEHQGRIYTLEAKRALGRAFRLLEGSRETGSIVPEGILTRRARADLPEELPLAVKVFVIWLTVIMWKREEDSSPAAAAGGAP